MKAIAKWLCRNDFESFVRTAFESTYPGQTFGGQLYLTFLCCEVARLVKQPQPWLVVNLPPQHLKTFICSVAFPAWVIGLNPAMKVVVIGNNDDLCRDIADLTGEIVNSAWYKKVFPRTHVRKNRQKLFDFATTRNGGIFIAPFGHSVTGRGGHYLIIDDPIDIAKISSKQIDKTNTILVEKYLSRPSHGEQSRVLLVHQRLHPNDPTGYVLSRYPGARHVSLPLIAEHDEMIPPGFRRKAGEALRPDVWTPTYIARMRELVGDSRYALIYQQDASGGIAGRITPLNFPRFKEAPKTPDIVISVDAAKRSGPRSSYSAILVFVRANGFYYLVKAKRGRWKYKELRRTLREVVQRWRPRAVLIEDAAHGTTLLEEDVFRWVAAAIDPGTRSKADRLLENLPTILSGHINVVDNAAGQAFIDEVVAFPFGKNDDQVDALTQFLSWVRDNPMEIRPQSGRSVGIVVSRGIPQHGPYTPLPPNHMAGPASRGPIQGGAYASRGRPFYWR